MEDPNYENAVQVLRSRLQSEPHAMPVKIALAEALFRSAIHPPKEPAEALKRLNEAIRLDPFRPAFYYHCGLQWHRLGDTERALSNYGRAVQFDPDNVRVLHQMALAHLDANNFEEARQKWEEAEKVIQQQQASKNPEGHNQQARERALFVIQCGRAEAALREGKAEEAFQCLQKIKPPQGLASLAGEMGLKYLVMVGQAQPMREWLEEALEPDDRDKVLQCLNPFLEAYQQSDHQEEFSLNLPLESSEGHVRVLWTLVAFDGAQKKGISVLRPLLHQFPDDDTLAQAYLALLHAEVSRLYHAGQWPEALYLWRQSLLFDPYGPAVAHNLALAATRSKVEADSIYWWKRVQGLWYTYAFLAPEVPIYQRTIAEKHLAFATKSKEKVLASQGQSLPMEALWQWIHEMEQYLLCEHYGFDSAYHLLGIPQSAKQETIDEAYQSMKAKTKAYPPNALPALQDAMLEARLGKLQQAYQSIRNESARRAYRCPKHVKELPRARELRTRRVEYLVKLGDYLEKEAREFPLDLADDYFEIAQCLLAHPYKALQRQFQDAGKADFSTGAAEHWRRALAEYYFVHIETLLGNRASEQGKAEHLLDHLRKLNPRHWQPLYHWAAIERKMGHVEEALALAREARGKCDQWRSRQVLDQFIEDTEKNADSYAVNRYLNPAIEYMNQKEWEKAIPLLRNAISRRPRMAELHRRMALCHAGLGQFSEAREYIRKAENCPLTTEMRKTIEEDKNDIKDMEIAPFNESAEACMNNRDWPGALQHLDEANEVNAHHALIHARRANCLLALDIEAIHNGSKPRSRNSVADVWIALEAARNCPNSGRFKDQIDSVEGQLRDVENRLN
jgi:tetratricopeptide (TPR) repeat protein